MVNSAHRNLYVAVVVLGVACYCVSFGPDGDGLGWYVRFAALAALTAAIGLLPKQTPHPGVIAVLAAIGFLDGLSNAVTAPGGWALTLIVVLGGLQAVVAIAALMLAPKPTGATATAGYEAYLDYYNQAVQHYYGQQGASQRGVYEQAQGQAYGQAPAAAQATAQPVAQPAQYGDYADLLSPQQDYGRTTANPPGEPGAAVPPPGRAGASPAAGSTGATARPAEPWPPTSP
ncbi:DUF5336 domain-containing protein [Mycolicibacterium sp. XJ870]